MESEAAHIWKNDFIGKFFLVLQIILHSMFFLFACDEVKMNDSGLCFCNKVF